MPLLQPFQIVLSIDDSREKSVPILLTDSIATYR
jgi:hypothetical protein